ncbi:hypothetical protein [Mycobacterium innocens]|uniref:hypothetical protein n=1 Tax=Mycobacterium innocens TaxID=2341083 RepID=UPI0010A97505|nr:MULTISPECIES: hypothetical protein [Mycobacterium]
MGSDLGSGLDHGGNLDAAKARSRLTRVYCSRSGARHALCELSRPADSAAAGEVIGADTPPRRDVLKVKRHARLVTENA